MIKNLIFDFGKVLVDYDFISFCEYHIPDIERRIKFMDIFCTQQMQDVFDYEMIPVDDLMHEQIKEHPEFEYEISLFFDKYSEVVTGEVPGMRELLIKFKAQGYKLYGLTNWCSKVYNTINQFDIFKLLDGYVISSEEHVIKPGPEIYQRLLSKFDLKASECLFTDDKLVNIEGGRRVGIEGIVFQSAEQYESQMVKICSERMA